MPIALTKHVENGVPTSPSRNAPSTIRGHMQALGPAGPDTWKLAEETMSTRAKSPGGPGDRTVGRLPRSPRTIPCLGKPPGTTGGLHHNLRLAKQRPWMQNTHAVTEGFRNDVT